MDKQALIIKRFDELQEETLRLWQQELPPQVDDITEEDGAADSPSQVGASNKDSSRMAGLEVGLLGEGSLEPASLAWVKFELVRGAIQGQLPDDRRGDFESFLLHLLVAVYRLRLRVSNGLSVALKRVEASEWPRLEITLIEGHSRSILPLLAEFTRNLTAPIVRGDIVTNGPNELVAFPWRLLIDWVLLDRGVTTTRPICLEQWWGEEGWQRGSFDLIECLDGFPEGTLNLGHIGLPRN
ncbi:hypothetical protein F4802DRAFT_122031 [Xylaria palmicola]|nr:hypothetical protein F4802DRAFT_122031 [Xylaria palmicola]